ncbi:H/ACA snoRNP pseudouridylase subunit [Brettanomyces nanus]|uniref:H/ACA ribonucleoprotein complex subunit n=1 Tax=Eeniella nana TaxID=13502 RepID=A0A875S428_EENNA|nr:H/ACA snoRNP pseudouridylase subunit [Brettanomyces nanus]QPG74529.1 H/ACA snoRNP pseudouridylase subunit [Brettanomyces nanus]
MYRQRGGFRGGYGHHDRPQNRGPPDRVLEMGIFFHSCEGSIVCRSINEKVPYFNAPIYLENKTEIGKVEEILGPVNEVYFTVKPSEGVQSDSFKDGDKFYIGGDKLLPLDRFLPKPKDYGPKPKRNRGPKREGGRGGFSRGGSRGGFSRGGRGGFSRGGRGGFSRGGRGGFNSRGRGGFSSRGRGGFISRGRGGFGSRGRGGFGERH